MSGTLRASDQEDLAEEETLNPRQKGWVGSGCAKFMWDMCVCFIERVSKGEDMACKDMVSGQSLAQ